MNEPTCCLCVETEDLWECETCGEYYCQAHWHETALGRNVECSTCENKRLKEVNYDNNL